MTTLRGGGEAGELIRSLDWASSPLGAIETWPIGLRTALGIVLNSRFPMFLWWGPELIQFYNDAYRPSFGEGKHPRAMGQSGRDCWGEIWPIIWPQIDDVLTHGKASWNEDQLVPILRNGRLEEVYWTYGYSPAFDDQDAIAGVLVVCTETTARVIAARRVHALADLAESIALASDPSAVDRSALQALGRAPFDLPFAIICLRSPGEGRYRVTESTGLTEARSVELIARLDLDSAATQEAPVTLPADQAIVAGPWPEPVAELFVQTILDGAGQPRGKLVLGLSGRLSFDAAYRDFIAQVAERLGLGLARADAFRTRTLVENERNNLLLQAPFPTAILTGPDHVYRLSNESYFRMVNRRDFVGKSFLEAFPETAGSPLPGVLDEVFRTGKAFVADEFPVVLTGAEGTLEEGFFKFSLEPLRDSRGEVYGMIAMGVDSTEQVRARRLLERTHQERETLLSDLEAANRAKDEFLAMLGHELRNPLSPIITALELMKLRAGGRASHEEQIIERQVKHLIRLVDDLLDVSKITRGKVELKREIVDVSDVISRAVEIASFLFEQRGHRLLIQAPAEAVPVNGDPVRLAQVLANLLTNAARYTDLGGTVTLCAEREHEHVVISVSDNGSGIAADMLDRIFEPFVQGKRTQERAQGGLGLGLALVKNLVLLHGGEVHAQSQGLGQGSVFSIRLPALPEGTSSETAPPKPSSRRSPSSKNVLIVDDNADAAELLNVLLKTAGHRVTTAHDPLDALEMVEKAAPEVAVLDIGLPVMDGYELGARIRDRAPSCRLIALTGYGQSEDRTRSAAAGFHAHLVKPVEIADLLAAISV
ncbi:MAG TPA: ATP-binding protein [Polyangiaceae bacterium]|nr:ATP-binding protein [Polyangiaceae bacterium]